MTLDSRHQAQALRALAQGCVLVGVGGWEGTGGVIGWVDAGAHTHRGDGRTAAASNTYTHMHTARRPTRATKHTWQTVW